MKVGERIKQRRKQIGMSADDLAVKIGKSPATIYRYENGDIKALDSDAILPVADAIGVTPGYLMGWEDDPQPLPHAVRPISDLHHQRVPLIGEAAAGAPIYAPEDLGVYVDSPVNADAAITVRGDSMEPTYLDGDLLYIKCVPDVPEGAVAVVFLDDEATVKHVYKRPTGLTLIGDNRASPPVMAEYADYDKIRVFGVPVGYTRIYKQKAKFKKGI